MTVVFKLGGSLLTRPGLADTIRTVLAQRAQHQRLIVVGGGATTDVVRDWSRIHNLSDETAHWLALSSLELNGQLLQGMFGWNCVNSRTVAEAHWASDLSPLLLDMTVFSKSEEANGTEPLPHNWTVTSDSMAAWAAICWPAEELILLKSVPCPHDLTAKEASRRQLVDPHFPQISQQLRRITWCNLRTSKTVIEPWLADSAETKDSPEK